MEQLGILINSLPATFPTNGQGLITAAAHRGFLQSLIESIARVGLSQYEDVGEPSFYEEGNKGFNAPAECAFFNIHYFGPYFLLLASKLRKPGGGEYAKITYEGYPFSTIDWFINLSPTKLTDFSLDTFGSFIIGSTESGANPCDYAILFSAT
jgi:hypothetical protein